MTDNDKTNFIQRAKMFDVDEKWFSISENNHDYPGFPRAPTNIPTGIVGTFRTWAMDVKKTYWRWRIKPLPTKILGPQFTRSRNLLKSTSLMIAIYTVWDAIAPVLRLQQTIRWRLRMLKFRQRFSFKAYRVEENPSSRR